jgi:hypothetical protein
MNVDLVRIAHQVHGHALPGSVERGEGATPVEAGAGMGKYGTRAGPGSGRSWNLLSRGAVPGA